MDRLNVTTQQVGNMREIGINLATGKLSLWWTAFVLVATDPGPLPLSAAGRWVLMSDGQPAASIEVPQRPVTLTT